MKIKRLCKFGIRNSKSGRLVVGVNDRWRKGGVGDGGRGSGEGRRGA